MKKQAFLWFLLLFLSIPFCSLAQPGAITCAPGGTFEAAFYLTSDSEWADGVKGHLEYDHDLFTILHPDGITGQDGIFILSGQPVFLSFSVSKYAPAGTYSIQVTVLEASNADGRLVTGGVHVAPVQVVVGGAAEPTAAPVSAAPEEDFEFEIRSGEVTVTAYIGPEPAVVIPDAILNKKVTKIGPYAFFQRGDLTQVTIPDSVTYIDNYAFANCTALTEITIPDSVLFIAPSAFANCTGLTAVRLSSRLMTVEDFAFLNCTNLTSVLIPSSVTSIGYQAFSGCASLTSVTIPASVKSINEFSFYQCHKNLVINVYQNSYALKFCKENHLRFIVR